jgi:hypothetical protein
MMETNDRNPDGTFKNGCNLNPEGKNGHAKGWTRYGDRAITLGEKYSQAEILEFANNEERRTKELSFWDGMCIVHMARTIQRKLTQTDSGADHVNKERESLLSRIEGQSRQVIDLTSRSAPKISDGATPEELSEAITAIRSQG